jgi:hypothetical protein
MSVKRGHMGDIVIRIQNGYGALAVRDAITMIHADCVCEWGEAHPMSVAMQKALRVVREAHAEVVASANALGYEDFDL